MNPKTPSWRERLISKRMAETGESRVQAMQAVARLHPSWSDLPPVIEFDRLKELLADEEDPDA